MANRYWVGGTATWDTTAGSKWALTSGGAGGQAVPTASDDVFFDAASGAAVVTVGSGNRDMLSVTFTGFTGTLTGSGSLRVTKDFILAAGMTYSFTGALLFNGSVQTGNVNFAGKTSQGSITFSGAGSTYTFQSDLLKFSATNWSNLSITAGTVNFNGYNIAMRAVSTAGGTLNCGSGTITLNYFLTPTGTINTQTATFVYTTVSSTNEVIDIIPHPQGGSWGDQALAADTINIAGSCGNVTFSTDTYKVYVASGVSFTSLTTLASRTVPLLFMGGTFTSPSSTSNRAVIPATACTVTCATTTLDDVTFVNIAAAGAASWTGTRIGDGNHNTGITFSTPQTMYWVGGTGSFHTLAEWATTSGGVTPPARHALPQDTMIFDTNSFPANGTITMPIMFAVGNFDLTNVPWTVAVNQSSGRGGLLAGDVVFPSTTANSSNINPLICTSVSGHITLWGNNSNTAGLIVPGFATCHLNAFVAKTVANIHVSPGGLLDIADVALTSSGQTSTLSDILVHDGTFFFSGTVGPSTGVTWTISGTGDIDNINNPAITGTIDLGTGGGTLTLTGAGGLASGGVLIMGTGTVISGAFSAPAGSSIYGGASAVMTVSTGTFTIANGVLITKLGALNLTTTSSTSANLGTGNQYGTITVNGNKTFQGGIVDNLVLNTGGAAGTTTFGSSPAMSVLQTLVTNGAPGALVAMNPSNLIKFAGPTNLNYIAVPTGARAQGVGWYMGPNSTQTGTGFGMKFAAPPAGGLSPINAGSLHVF